jgi:hypothetical protein
MSLKTGLARSFSQLFLSLLAVILCGMPSIIAIKTFLGSHDGSVSGDNRSGISQNYIRRSNYKGATRQSHKRSRIAQQTTEKPWIYSAGPDFGNTKHSNNLGGEKVMATQVVPAAVTSATSNVETQEAMLLGSSLEGGWSTPFPVGDAGTSFGPYQMHIGGALTSSGLSPAQAENATLATNAMLPAYQAAVNSIPQSLWSSNPEQAAEQAAYKAERPAQDYYTTDGSATINSKWSQVVSALGNPATLTSANTSSSGGSSTLSGIEEVIQGIFTGNPAEIAGGLTGTALSGVKADAERIGLVVLGGLLILVGIIVFALPAAKTAARTAGSFTATGKALGVGSAAAAAESQRKQAIANRSMELGEKKLALKQQRENRLARSQYAKG